MNQKEVSPSMPQFRPDNSLKRNSGLLRLFPILVRLIFSAGFLICCASQAYAGNTALAATLDLNKYANLYEACSFGKSGFQDIRESTGMMRLSFEHHESIPDMPSAIDKTNWFFEGTQFPVNDKIAEPMAMYSKLSNHWRKCFLFRTEDADLARLQSQTGLMFGMGLVAAGILAAMPESVSKWDMEGVTAGYMLEKWWDNVSSGPVWDRDEWYMNYIGHTYDGGVYYQIARNSGYSQWDSFVYTTLMSTFFWEYGFEAFAEVPSIQDLIVTPVGGWLYGEWAYKTENAIKSNNYKVLGNKWLGYAAVFLLDPINYIAEGINLVAGREWIITGSFAVIGPSGRDNPNVIGPISINPQMHLSFHRDF